MDENQKSTFVRPYHHGRLRDRLIELGEKALLENRLQNTSLRDLAKTIGVSHSAPYRHFANREALEIALLEKAVDLWLKLALDVDAKNSLSPIDRLISFGQGLSNLAGTSAAHLQLVLRASFSNESPTLQKKKAEMFRLFLRWIVEGLHNENLRKGYEPVHILKSIWALYIGAIQLAASHWTPGPKREQNDQTMKIIETGIRAIFKSQDK